MAAYRELVRRGIVNRRTLTRRVPSMPIDDERKRLIGETQTLQQRQNQVSKLIPTEKDKDKKQALIQEGRDLREKVTALEARHRTVTPTAPPSACCTLVPT